MKVVGIVWIDTVSQGDCWVTETETPASIVSVGILWKDEPDYVTLVLSLSEDELIRGYVTIPRNCIKEYKEIDVDTTEQGNNQGICGESTPQEV